MNDLRFTELPEAKQKERKEWLITARAHVGEEHQRWGDSFFKTLILAHTGGVAVVASLMSSTQSFGDSMCLRLALTFFVFGLVAALIAIRHEFVGVSRKVGLWDRHYADYIAGRITFGEFYKPIEDLSVITLWDRVIGWLPLVLFIAGAVVGFLFLWF